MNAFSHLTYQELENRKKFLKQEYHRVCTELERRKNTNTMDGDLWEPLENLKERVVREYKFPNEINKHMEIEEKKLTKEGVNNIKQMIGQIKSGIKNEIAKDVGIINNDIQRLLQIGDEIAANEKKKSSNIHFQKDFEDFQQNSDNESNESVESSEDDKEEIDLDRNKNEKNITILSENNQNTKKRVLGKKKKTYEDLNPVIRDLWTNN